MKREIRPSDPTTGPVQSNPYYRSLAPMIHWPSATRPLRPAAHFGRRAPLEVEIGFGNGEALVRRAAVQPDRNFLGLEIAWDSVKRALRRINDRGCLNVRLLMVDAALALNRLIPPGSVHDFVALFPPPWPKDRHEKRRLFGTEFMEIAADRLIAGGRFKIVTDDIDYRDWIASGIPDRWYRAESLVIPAGYDTKYERKWMDAGQDRFYQLELTKIDHPDRPPQEDLAVESHRINCFHPDAFTPRDHEGPLTVKFRDWLYDPRREIMAVQVLTVEDRLKQMIWVLIARKDDGWLVSLAHSTQVVPGEAVRLALDLTRRAAEKTVE